MISLAIKIDLRQLESNGSVLRVKVTLTQEGIKRIKTHTGSMVMKPKKLELSEVLKACRS